MPTEDSGPDFPSVPDHPHYRLLRDLAREMEGNLPFPDAFTADEKIDGRSVFAALDERSHTACEAILELQAEGKLPTMDAIVGASMYDGFALGYLFAVNRPDLP